MENHKLTIVIPQWQGGGQDFCTWYGGIALRDRYLRDENAVTAGITRGPISPLKEDILGYDDIVRSMDIVTQILVEKNPSRIFTIGGGCDADTPCAAWLGKMYPHDMAVIYIDAHGDLNTPASSASKLYYGMSLRALLGEGAPGIVGRLSSTIQPDQLISCAGRNLDPEEIRYKKENFISDFSAEQLNQDPAAAAREAVRKGFHHIYIHVDFDSLDPAEFALTPVQEPNGITRNTLMSMLRALKESPAKIVGLGLLEYAGTDKDRNDDLVDFLVKFGEEI